MGMSYPWTSRSIRTVGTFCAEWNWMMLVASLSPPMLSRPSTLRETRSPGRYARILLVVVRVVDVQAEPALPEQPLGMPDCVSVVGVADVLDDH